MAEYKTSISIEIKFDTAKAAHKYCDAMPSFNVGSELYFGLRRFRLFTDCGSGYMKNTADGYIVLMIEGWTQWANVDPDDVEDIVRYFVELTRSKPVQIEILIKDAMFDKHYLVTWRADDKDCFRTSSISDNDYKSIQSTMNETASDKQTEDDVQLLKRLLRMHTTFNKVRYWYLLNLKHIPYL